MRESFFWVLVFAGHMAAYTLLAMLLVLPLGLNGFWCGYVGWGIVLAMLLLEMDPETRDALKRWAIRRGGPNE